MNFNLYYYQARLASVYDGDTCRLDIDLGLNIWRKNEKIRLARINTPELRDETLDEGRKARDFLKVQLENKPLVIETIRDKKEKYGRYLAEIWCQDQAGTWINVNDLMVKEGYATYYS